jgi:thioredoxin reductase (NADPH)
MEGMKHAVVVIGGGPSGLAAAIYLARANLSPLVFAGFPPGGQLMLTSEVENYPGYRHIQGPELVSQIRRQAESFGARVIDVNVKRIQKQVGEFIIDSPEAEPEDRSITSQTILIATGAKALWLGLDSEKRFSGKGVSACATCDGYFFQQKIVAVVGGGDTACEEALYLTKFAKKVFLVHRRERLRASKIMQDRVLRHPKITVLWNSQVVDIFGNSRVEGISLRSTTTNEVKDLPVDGVFIAIGHRPDTEIFRGLVEMDEGGYIITQDTYARSVLRGDDRQSKLSFVQSSHYYSSATTTKGVFAAGDCVDYTYRQAATAVGMGVAASIDIERFLQSEE